jgi:cytosine/adenosine deaminase-related metal-dependent hydrolase
VWVNQKEIDLYAHTGCGVAHCPSSNMRLASGIAPVREFLAAGVRLGLGVDGSASNDSSHLIAETRQAMLLARVRAGVEGASLSGSAAPILTARQTLEIATRGGASVLGRDDIGSLEPGKCADFIALNLNRLDFTGSLHDPLAAVLFCNPVNVDYNLVGGQFVVKEGQLVNMDLEEHIVKHNQAARRLMEG